LGMYWFSFHVLLPRTPKPLGDEGELKIIIQMKALKLLLIA